MVSRIMRCDSESSIVHPTASNRFTKGPLCRSQPSRAYWRAQTRPRPRLAPVINTLLIGRVAWWMRQAFLRARKLPASGRIAHLAAQRARGVLECPALGVGHLVPPHVEPGRVGSTGEVGVNPSALLARDHLTACMPATLQALDSRRALRAVVEHDRIPGQ